MTDIDETIKKRQEKEKLSGDIGTMKKEKGKIVDQITEERRKLETLRKGKEKFLEDREKEAEERTRVAESKIRKAIEGLRALEEEAVRVTTEVIDRTETAVKGVLFLTKRSEELVGRSDYLKEQSEKVVDQLKKASEGLEKKILINSGIEKDLLNREEEVDKKYKEANRKLRKAKDLAYWHKTPGATYKEE